RDVLFIDEIHRMHISVEEILYSAMEDYRLDILIGQGASARTMQIDLVPYIGGGHHSQRIAVQSLARPVYGAFTF
ncbi:MAG: hypothetical protein WD025_04170, partial [Bacteriovoracaceae bacterium]